MHRFFRLFIDGLFVVLFFSILLLVIFALRGGETGQFSGRATIIDGDSIHLVGANIRLAGIDAPEIKQKCEKGGTEYSCGVNAKKHLQDLIGDGTVDCRLFGRDYYERLLAQCSVGDVSLNERMVLDGWAVDYGGYALAEAKAVSAKNGLWSGTFEQPDAFRRAQGIHTENNISDWLVFSKLKAKEFGADIAQKFGLYGD